MNTKHKKALTVGGFLVGFLIFMAVAFVIFAENADKIDAKPIIMEKNVSIDLPMGGKAVIGEVSRNGGSIPKLVTDQDEVTTTLSNVMIDIPNVEKGTVEKIVLTGHAAKTEDVKSIRSVEIFNVNMTDFHADSIVYTDLELDFPLLKTMNPANMDDLKKLLQSFRLKGSEVRNFTSQDGASFISVARSGASDCSATTVKDAFLEGVKGNIDGQISFAVDKITVALVELPNILMALDPESEKHIEQILDSMKVKGFAIDGLSAGMGEAKAALANLTFNFDDSDASGRLDCAFNELEVPSELLAMLGMGSIWKGNGPMKADGDVVCDLTEEGDIITADQKARFSIANYVSAGYTAKTLFNMKNHGIVNESAELVVKDAGLVESLPLPMQMFLFAQAMQVDPAIGQGVKTFLETPGKTMTVRASEQGGDTQIEIDVQ